MRPDLFEVMGYSVPSYLVFMALGYVVALGLILHLIQQARRMSLGPLDRHQAIDLFWVMTVSSLLGAKIGHTLFEAGAHVDAQGRPLHNVFALLKEDPLHWLKLGEAGWVWYGGLLLALGVAFFYFRRRPHLPAWLYADLFTPAIMMGAFFGRMGCFLSGCCYGRVSDVPWAVTFPGKHHAVHPTQLYDAGFALLLGAFLWWRFFRRRFDGENISLLLLGYALARGASEIFRGDPERGFVGPLSTSQALSVLLFGLGVWLYRARRKLMQP